MSVYSYKFKLQKKKNLILILSHKKIPRKQNAYLQSKSVFLTKLLRNLLTCDGDSNCTDDEQHVGTLAAESGPQNHGSYGVYKLSCSIGSELTNFDSLVLLFFFFLRNHVKFTKLSSMYEDIIRNKTMCTCFTFKRQKYLKTK